jgi:hypothetical protein
MLSLAAWLEYGNRQATSECNPCSGSLAAMATRPADAEVIFTDVMPGTDPETGQDTEVTPLLIALDASLCLAVDLVLVLVWRITLL